MVGFWCQYSSTKNWCINKKFHSSNVIFYSSSAKFYSSKYIHSSDNFIFLFIKIFLFIRQLYFLFIKFFLFIRQLYFLFIILGHSLALSSLKRETVRQFRNLVFKLYALTTIFALHRWVYSLKMIDCTPRAGTLCI